MEIEIQTRATQRAAMAEKSSCCCCSFAFNSIRSLFPSFPQAHFHFDGQSLSRSQSLTLFARVLTVRFLVNERERKKERIPGLNPSSKKELEALVSVTHWASVSISQMSPPRVKVRPICLSIYIQSTLCPALPTVTTRWQLFPLLRLTSKSNNKNLTNCRRQLDSQSVLDQILICQFQKKNWQVKPKSKHLTRERLNN